MIYFDVVVLGGGPSGLMCALTAGKRGRSVLVVEHNKSFGKKLLISGGGRSNFTNLFVEPHNFISSNPHFCKSALRRFSQWDFIAMLETHGISYHEREHGQLFCDNSSVQILEMLLYECKNTGVTFRSLTTVKGVEPLKEGSSGNGRFLLETNNGDLETRSLVIATGGLSCPGIGSTGFGYEVARKFGVNVVPVIPALVPLVLEKNIKQVCARLSGISLTVYLETKNTSFTGELLFTHRGISGPAVLQISSYWERGEDIVLNFFPGTDIEPFLESKKEKFPQKRLRSVLSETLPKKLVAVLQSMFWKQWAEKPMGSIPDQVLKEIGVSLTAWKIRPVETEGFKKAEATLGGVDTNDLSSKTMESMRNPGLFFTGEVVDVTGQLGGFNLQWAWSSGAAAGQFA